MGSGMTPFDRANSINLADLNRATQPGLELHAPLSCKEPTRGCFCRVDNRPVGASHEATFACRNLLLLRVHLHLRHHAPTNDTFVFVLSQYDRASARKRPAASPFKLPEEIMPQSTQNPRLAHTAANRPATPPEDPDETVYLRAPHEEVALRRSNVFSAPGRRCQFVDLGTSQRPPSPCTLRCGRR